MESDGKVALVLFKEEIQRKQRVIKEDRGVERIWKNVKETLVMVAEKTVGRMKGGKPKEKRHGGGMRKYKT